MAVVRLVFEHNGTIFEPPIKDDIKLEWERIGSPGKLTFTTVKIKNAGMNFAEGDTVWLYYDGEIIFKGYVFTKKRDREQHIQVTCYDQLRYLKNKFSYVFENKTASQIVQSICKDYGVKTGILDDTKYVIPVLSEEDQSAMDIILSALQETMVNTGEMYVLYDDCGEICLRNVSNMVSDVIITKETAENIDYSSSIDNETYNSIVLYYDPVKASYAGGGGGGLNALTAGNVGNRIVAMARTQLGVSEDPPESSNVIYNTAYYGKAVYTHYEFEPIYKHGGMSGEDALAEKLAYKKWEQNGYTQKKIRYEWCAVFIWWVYRECGLSHLFYDGNKTASVYKLMDWYKDNNKYHTSNPRPGDTAFMSGHVGIVESVNGDTITLIEGNVGCRVARMTRKISTLYGFGRP